MPFGMVNEVGLGMGVLDFCGDRRRGNGSFRGEFVASHCNQWGLCDALFSNYFEDLFVTLHVFNIVGGELSTQPSVPQGSMTISFLSCLYICVYSTG